MTASSIALRWGAATSTGWRSDGNEDSFVVDETLFAVADGLGGYKGGEIASKLAVRILHLAARQKTLPMSGWLDDLLLPDHIRSFKPGTRSLYQTFREIDRAILERATQDLHLTGMATTLCAMQIHRGEEFGAPYFSVANVGDSRLYRFSGNRLQQITEDHTRSPRAHPRRQNDRAPSRPARVSPQAHPSSRGLSQRARGRHVGYASRGGRPIHALQRRAGGRHRQPRHHPHLG